MEGFTAHAPMTDVLRERRVFDRHPFVLVDIGCAGGIDDAWRAFGPSLVARGYDPDILACEEAQARETFNGVRYVPRFVGLSEEHQFVEQRLADARRWPDTNIWGRVTAGALASRQQSVAAAPSIRLADPSTLVGVDHIVLGEKLTTVDFLKIDVDGRDLDVLESARGVLGEKQVLGVGLEVNWFGTASRTQHTFHNTDLFLREQGYELFGLTVRSYSRTDLPAPFLYEFYAQTRFGQPYQGDAIYVRDLAAPYHWELARTYPAAKLAKLACIYELIGLPDCSAEVLNRFREQLAVLGDLDELLDALTPPLLGEKLTYREYIKRFEQQPELFLPSAETSRAAKSSDPASSDPPDTGPAVWRRRTLAGSRGHLQRLLRRTSRILTSSRAR
jgi:Methyltransferase FkbM domain